MQRVVGRWLVLFLTICFCVSLWASPIKAPVELNTRLGWQYLSESSHSNTDFGSLVRYFQTQQNLAYCGVASSVMVLNALAVKAPIVPVFYPYRFFNQNNLFSVGLLQQGLTPYFVSHHGLTLKQLSTILSFYQLKVNAFHAASLTEAKTEQIITHAMQSPNHYVLVNYFRPVFKQRGGGHISPIGAVDPARHAVLIMDVASYKYPAIWVSFKALYRAMSEVDKTSGKSRGCLVIRR